MAQLRSVSAASPSARSGYGKGAGPRVPTQKHSFTSCGGRAIAVVQRGRDHRLAELGRGSAVRLLSPVGYDFASPSCSPRGRFIVAERKPTSAGMAANRVVLLKGDGTFIREVHGGVDAEHAPRWGRSGVSFVHHVHVHHEQRWMGEIWFIKERGIQTPTGLHVRRVWGTWAYDWSADNAP